LFILGSNKDISKAGEFNTYELEIQFELSDFLYGGKLNIAYDTVFGFITD